MSSPNMNLPIPTVSVTDGPEWATLINNCLNLIDSHDHTSGNGVPITPSALSITADLSIGTNSLTDVKSIEFTTQSVALVTTNTAYVLNGDFYFIDGTGNSIQITDSGGVAGTPGSIAGLVSPASATFVPSSGKFKWEQDVNIAADMDFASAIMRNSSPNSTFALTLKPPAALAANYSITLPALPGANKILRMDNNGIITASLDTDNSTLEISGNVLQVKDAGITGTKIAIATVTGSNIAASTITYANIFSNTITGNEIAPNPNIPGNTLQENGKNVLVSNTNASASLAIIRGRYGVGGGLVQGEGFTTTALGLGDIQVNFDTAFAAAPVVVANIWNAGQSLAITVASSTTSCQIVTEDTGGVRVGRQVNFIAIGIRA